MLIKRSRSSWRKSWWRRNAQSWLLLILAVVLTATAVGLARLMV